MSLAALKPAASARQHLLLAGMMWSAVGAGLASFGCRWIASGSPGSVPWLHLAAAAAGLTKSLLVLDRAGRRIAARIRARGNGRCIGGFLSLRSWGLVALMGGGGRLLRETALTPAVAGCLYLAVGTGLLISSRLLWREWARPPTEFGDARR